MSHVNRLIQDAHDWDPLLGSMVRGPLDLPTQNGPKGFGQLDLGSPVEKLSEVAPLPAELSRDFDALSHGQVRAPIDFRGCVRQLMVSEMRELKALALSIPGLDLYQPFDRFADRARTVVRRKVWRIRSTQTRFRSSRPSGVAYFPSASMTARSLVRGFSGRK